MNYLTGIHRYSTNSGIPGFILELATQDVREGIKRTGFWVQWLDSKAKIDTDFIPLESVLLGHYIITPFRPKPEHIEQFRQDGDSVPPYKYDHYIQHHEVK